MDIGPSFDVSNIRVTTREGIGDGNGRLDKRRFRPSQNKDRSGTSDNNVKTLDIDRRRNNKSSKLHRLLVRSCRSPNRDDGDIKSITSNGSKTIVASTSDRALQPPIITPKKQNRYSTMMTMMDFYSYSPSPTPVAVAITPSTTTSSSSTTGSTISNSRRTHSSTSFSTYFSHSDNDDIGIDGTYDEAIGWRVDSDDEGSQTTMSIRSPLISKLLRDEMERRDGSKNEQDNAECNTSSDLCEFACFWSIWVCMWILLFALSMSINSKSYHEDSEHGEDRETQLMIWDQIRYASSIFWTVGGSSYRGNDGPHINGFHQIVACIFMTGSLGFMGLALGEWGDAIIRAYDATIFKNGEDVDKNFHAQNYNTLEKSRQIYHRRRQKTVSYDHERRRTRPWYTTSAKGTGSYYGSLPLSSIRHRRHQSRDQRLLKFPDSSDDESAYGNSNKVDADDDDSCILFPRIHWLLMQSLLLTILSIICVTSIRYCEQNRNSLRTTGGTYKNETTTVDDSEDEWDLVSTLYYAVSTATTSGVRNAMQPVSVDGQFFELIFLPLSVITSLHWMVYIAQNRMQQAQRIRCELKKRRAEGGGMVLKDHRFKTDAKEQIFLVPDCQRTPNTHNGVVYDKYNDDDDDDDDDDDNDDFIVRTPIVSSLSRQAVSVPSLEYFYELELQQMGLVDIETFRVLKRKHALQQRLQLKETEGC